MGRIEPALALAFGILTIISSNVAGTTQDPSDSRKSSTIGDELRQLKKLALENRDNVRKLSARLSTMTEEDDDALLFFLRMECIRRMVKYSEVEIGNLSEFNLTLLNYLVERMVTEGGKGKSGEPLGFAAAIVDLSCFISIDRKTLSPVLDHQNKEVATLAATAWDCVRYDGLPADAGQIVGWWERMREDFAKAVGTLDDWQELASERGYQVVFDDGESTKKFIEDCGKRIADIDNDMDNGNVRPLEGRHRKYREMLLMVRAFDELRDEDRGWLCNYCVHLMDEGSDIAWFAGYRLYKLTGRHFPLAAFLDYRGSRTNVHLEAKAAQAWKKWLTATNLSAIPKPDEKSMGLEERLAAFQRDRRMGAGPEFNRPIDAVVDEILTATDNRVLDMLVAVLATKSLTETQIAKIVQTAKNDESEGHRLFLWKALFSSGSTSARAYLSSVINAKTEEGLTIQFLSVIDRIDAANMPFLASLFVDHPSMTVKDAVARLAFGYDRWGTESDAMGIQLAEMILKNAKEPRHKVDAIKTLVHRAGVNWEGRQIVEEWMKTERSPEARKAAYRILVQRDPDRWIKNALSLQETEDIKIEALNTLESSLQEGKSILVLMPDDILPHLKKAAKEDSSEKVRRAATAVLDTMRRKEARKIIDRCAESQSWEIDSLRREYQGREEELKQILEMTFKRSERVRTTGTDREIAALKEKYGVLPEETEIRAKSDEKARKQQDLIRELLIELNKK